MKRLKAIATDYECDARALVEIAIEELIAAHQKPKVPEVQKRTVKPATPRPASPERTGRSYAEKLCIDCGNAFQPSGPRATRCGRCRTGEGASTKPDAPEVVWNGAMGRNGTSLTGHLR